MAANDHVHDVQFNYVTKDWGERRPIHRLQALQGDTEVGSMHWDSKRIRDLTVSPEHQRKGVATSLWQEGHRLAEENSRIPKPQHSTQRTDAGDAWAKSVGGSLPRRDRR